MWWVLALERGALASTNGYRASRPLPAVALPSPGTFYFLAAGEENVGEDGRWALPKPMRFRLFSFVLPGTLSRAQHPRARGATGTDPRALPRAPWEFPMEVRQCLELVVDLARRLNKKVDVVDVHRPGERGELAARWSDPGILYPILVASSGERLEGLGAFTPRRVRAFLRRG